MGIRDIMIGYKFAPVHNTPVFQTNPFLAAMKKAMEDTGHDASDIRENYEDETEFINRVKEFWIDIQEFLHTRMSKWKMY